MIQVIAITREEIFNQVKLSCQLPELIEGIVTRKAISAAAEEAGIQVEPKELQQAADQFRLINNLRSAEETWTWLQKHNLSLDEFEEMIGINLISGKLANHLFADQVEAYFFENQLNYAGAVIYEVVLEDEDLAMELFYAIQEGEMSFHDIARQYIQDKELRRIGGYRGIVRRQQLKPEISAAVFAANPPQVLKPIITSQGVHLIGVEEIIQPELDNILRYQIISNLFSEWLKQQVEKIEIVNCLEVSSQAA